MSNQFCFICGMPILAEVKYGEKAVNASYAAWVEPSLPPGKRFVQVCSERCMDEATSPYEAEERSITN